MLDVYGTEETTVVRHLDLSHVILFGRIAPGLFIAI